ncbi:MAG: hypothetical protein QG584_2571 [Pseudomonadota bacterium]|nr:hypothetical protein [Pseudomonadota bacterium]
MILTRQSQRLRIERFQETNRLAAKPAQFFNDLMSINDGVFRKIGRKPLLGGIQLFLQRTPAIGIDLALKINRLHGIT